MTTAANNGPSGGQQSLTDAVDAIRGKPGTRIKRSIPVADGIIELQVSAFDNNYFASLSTSVELYQEPKADGTYRDAAPKQPDRPVVDGLIPIEFREETGSDDTGKALGLNQEFQVGDPAFDDRVYIDSNAPDAYMRTVLAEETLRESLRVLVFDAHQSVRLNEKGPKLELHIAKPWNETDRVQAAVDNLANVRRHLPLFTATRKDARRRVDKVMPFVGLATLTLTTLAGATEFWTLVDTTPVVYGILGGAMLWCVYAIVIWFFARGGPRALRTFAFGALPALIGLPAGTVGGLVLVNGALDPEPLVSHEVRVVGKYTEGQASKRTYWVSVSDWRPKHKGKVRIRVEESLWNRVREDESVVVTAGPGRFGWAWVDRVGFAASR